MQGAKATTAWTVAVIAGMISFGTINTISICFLSYSLIALKGQTKRQVYGHNFIHPFIQV
jgi:hypothetical protein